QAGHVLYADRVDAGFLEFPGDAEIMLGIVYGTQSEYDGTLRMAAGLLRGLDCRAHIAHVVERVEDADNVDSVSHRELAEGRHHIVGVVPVTDQILAAQ